MSVDRNSSIAILFFLTLYISFPTANSNMDGIGYAADAKWGNYLFAPHHLFFTAFIWLIGHGIALISQSQLDYLSLGKLINAVSSAGCLIVLWHCLKTIGTSKGKAFWLLIATGSSYSVMRFATENETYVLPIFCSLLGTYYFINWLNFNRNYSIRWAGFWLSLACLFHQIHFFWWIGIAVAILVKNKKSLLDYLPAALMVPIFYIFVCSVYYQIPFSTTNLFRFVFDNFHSGSAYLSFNLVGVARFFFSLLRTFIQVHGTTWLLIKENIWMALPALFIIPFFGFQLVKSKFWLAPKSFGFMVLTFIGIASLHLLFALVSLGNSEFMVMIPYLLSLVLASFTSLNERLIRNFALGLLCWNIVYGLVPSKIYKFTDYEYWAKKAIAEPKAAFLMRQYGEVANQEYLLNGKVINNVIYVNPDNKEFKKVYTDFDRKAPFLNSEGILFKGRQAEFFKTYKLSKVDSVHVFSHWDYLFVVRK
jgi:hypothetical protein